jgi:cupin 2 domain-containing protein
MVEQAEPGIRKSNLFDNIPEKIGNEVFNPLVKRSGLRIQRILSQGQTTDWQKSDTNEWVVLLAGGAKLLFEKDNREVCMKPGDYVLIPAGCRHRVSWTDPQQKSVWLAVHYPAANPVKWDGQDSALRAERKRRHGPAFGPGLAQRAGRG